MMRSLYKNSLTLLAILLALGLIYRFLVPSKGIIVLKDLSRDTCILLRKENGDTIWASRRLKVIENTFNDTTVCFGGVLHPGSIGKRTDKLLRKADGTTVLLYDDGDTELPKVDRLYAGLWQNRPVKGKVVVEYYY